MKSWENLIESKNIEFVKIRENSINQKNVRFWIH